MLRNGNIRIAILVIVALVLLIAPVLAGPDCPTPPPSSVQISDTSGSPNMAEIITLSLSIVSCLACLYLAVSSRRKNR